MPWSVAIALGSNLGDRRRNLRQAIEHLRHVVSVVRLSSILESDPVDAPPGSPRFLNMVAVGHTHLSPEDLLDALQGIETRLGRTRGVRNAPRRIDLDLILHSAHVRRSARLTLPHPRYREREFVMKPLRELRLPWELCDGLNGQRPTANGQRLTANAYRVPKPPPSETCRCACCVSRAWASRG